MRKTAGRPYRREQAPYPIGPPGPAGTEQDGAADDPASTVSNDLRAARTWLRSRHQSNDSRA